VRLENGQAVSCSDGDFGELADVVIDPTTRRVTHLVVQPADEQISSRLVPIELARPGDDPSKIALDCTIEQAGNLEHVQELAYLRGGEFPVADPGWEVGVETVLASPYYPSAALGGALYDGSAVAGPTGGGEFDPHYEAAYDRIPKGEVEIRRASEVLSADGDHVGHVDGFLVDEKGLITHVVLEQTHFWRGREVTIPIENVAGVETDRVSLNLSKKDVGALPSRPVHRWGL
jgi:sporulation protein YlmC with PRC-barrel domain